MKLDLEKAYDKVNWSFLDHILQAKGFGMVEKMDMGLPLHFKFLDSN